MAGDLVVLLSPASPPRATAGLPAAVNSLRRLGLRVLLGANAQKQYGYLAGRELERAADLAQAFLTPAVKGIICTRGGYGCSRLLDQISVARLARHPKVFVGFSDITLLHLAMQKA
ncbi:LD-carboxypeptidase, partial [candidate division FCPU426 bacterium]|nr:LD-carboxypeptidase [candidate division FCPU426 bacterium]